MVEKNDSNTAALNIPMHVCIGGLYGVNGYVRTNQHIQVDSFEAHLNKLLNVVLYHAPGACVNTPSELELMLIIRFYQLRKSAGATTREIAAEFINRKGIGHCADDMVRSLYFTSRYASRELTFLETKMMTREIRPAQARHVENMFEWIRSFVFNVPWDTAPANLINTG